MYFHILNYNPKYLGINYLTITVFCPVFIKPHANADDAHVRILACHLIYKVKNGKA